MRALRRSLAASWRSNALLVLMVGWVALFVPVFLVLLGTAGLIPAAVSSFVFEAGVIGLLVAARVRGRRRRWS